MQIPEMKVITSRLSRLHSRYSVATEGTKPLFCFALCLMLMLEIPESLCCWGGDGDKLEDYTFSTAAIAADHANCSLIGRNIMETFDGNAVDAAIAAMLCVGVVNPHSAGIGGGHMTVYYDRLRQEAKVINAREKAPLAAREDMFKDHEEEGEKNGVLYIAVPGELKGYYELFQSAGSGKVLWRQLFEPTIKLARNGFPVGKALAKALQISKDYILDDPGLREVFTKNGEDLYTEKEVIRFTKLAETLEIIADRGSPIPFYTGELVADIVREISEAGGIIKSSDLAQFTAPVDETITVNLNGLTMHSANPPASGAVASYILKILEGYLFDKASLSDQKSLTYHRIIEAFKFGCSQSPGLGDLDFDRTGEITNIVNKLLQPSEAHLAKSKIRDDTTLDVSDYGDPKGCEIYDKGGTTHVSVIDGQGNAVAMTSSINYHFGAKFRGTHTGIIYNNHMADFNNPTDTLVISNSGNFIEPGKRPMSAMVPSVIVSDTGDVRLVTGGAGAARITTSTALVIMHSLWFDKNVVKSIKQERLHYNGDKYVNGESRPKGTVHIEPNLYENIKQGLKNRNHYIEKDSSIAVMQLVTREDGTLYAYSDDRKPGAKATGY